MSVPMWSEEKVNELIELYRQHPVLWDVTHKNYKNRNLKNDALRIISLTLNCEVLEVERKITVILAQFRKTRHKVLNMKKSGMTAEEIDKNIWYGYRKLEFLEDRFAVDASRSAGLQESHSSEINNNERTELVNTRSLQHSAEKICPPLNSQQNKRTHEDMIEESFRVIKRLSCSVRDKDECDIFGKHVACSIRNLKSDFVKSTVKHYINNILYQAEIGEFDPQYLISSQISARSTSPSSNSPYCNKHDEDSAL